LLVGRHTGGRGTRSMMTILLRFSSQPPIACCVALRAATPRRDSGPVPPGTRGICIWAAGGKALASRAGRQGPWKRAKRDLGTCRTGR
jgi:hypothetical protein